MRRVQPYLPSDVRRARQIESTFVGTMGGTVITSPIRRRYPAKQPRMAPTVSCPDLFAWYRGDDIIEAIEGTPVDAWPDRAGSLDLGKEPGEGTWRPRYAVNAVGGQSGVEGPEEGVDIGWFHASFALPDPSTWDGVTLAVVVRGVGGNTHPSQSYFEVSDTDGTVFNGVAWKRGEQTAYFASSEGTAFVSGTAAMEGSHLLVATLHEGTARLVLDGAELDTAALGGTVAAPQTINLFVATSEVEGAPPNFLAEAKAWSAGLSDECVAEEWSYAQDRYGLS